MGDCDFVDLQTIESMEYDCDSFCSLGFVLIKGKLDSSIDQRIFTFLSCFTPRHIQIRFRRLSRSRTSSTRMRRYICMMIIVFSLNRMMIFEGILFSLLTSSSYPMITWLRKIRISSIDTIHRFFLSKKNPISFIFLESPMKISHENIRTKPLNDIIGC